MIGKMQKNQQYNVQTRELVRRAHSRMKRKMASEKKAYLFWVGVRTLYIKFLLSLCVHYCAELLSLDFELFELFCFKVAFLTRVRINGELCHFRVLKS